MKHFASADENICTGFFMIVKRILTVSIAANIGLLGMVGYLGINQQALPETQADPPLQASPPSPAPSKIVSTAPEKARFDWSQIEATDYRTYIANLRGIRCPDQTIFDIVTADIAALYDQKRADLKSRDLDPIRFTQAAEKLQQEKTDLLVSLFGAKDVPSAARTQAGTITDAGIGPDGISQRKSFQANRKLPSQEQPILIPLALLSPAPAITLNGDQKAAWENIRQDFIQEIGGPNQNPNDPEYRRRWIRAQPAFDERFKAAFGQDEFARLQAKLTQEMAPTAQ